MYRVITTMCITGLFSAAVNVAASEVLKYNPFEQPDLYDGSWNGNGKAAASSALELRGTLVDGEDSMANIGGDYYRLNHEVSGYRILRIETGSVTLTRAGNETVLTIHEDE